MPALLFALSVLVAPSALGAVGGSVTAAFPSPLVVGDIKTGTITFVNRSSFPNDGENVTVTDIVFTPSCSASDGTDCFGPDPGVFSFAAGVGKTGTSCANIRFVPGTPDPASGSMILTPNAPVVLGPANGSGPLSKQCVVNINFQVMKLPADSTPGSLPLTTMSLAQALLRGTATSLFGFAGGGSVTAISLPDGAAPTVAIEDPTKKADWSTSTSPLALGGTAADDVGVMSVSWANAATGATGVASGTTSWTASVPLAAGDNVITVTARDGVNKTGTDTLTVTYTPVVLPPAPTAGAVAVSNTAYGNFVDGSFTLTTPFNSTAALSGCEYTIDNGVSWLAATVSGSAPSFNCTKTGIARANGEVLNLSMRASNAGGTGTAAAIARTVDALAPVTTSSAPAAWVGTSQTVILTPGDGDGSGIASTQHCTDTANSCNPNTTGSSVAVGCAAGSACQTYVRFRSTDNLGNVESIKSALVRIDLGAPVNGTLTATPGAGQVVLSWSGFSDAASGLSGATPYKLVFGTAGSPAASCTTGTILMTGTGTSFTHLSLTNGTTYHYRVCATDAVGNVSSGATASATPQGTNQPPDADAGPDREVTVATSITLSGAGSSDPDGTIASYAWNFGDGTSANTGSVPTVAHTYAQTGSYTVTLTVTDNKGATASDTAVVAVVPPGSGTYRWATRFGGAGNWVLGYGTAIDRDGNVIVVGTHWGTVNFGSGAQTSAGSSDIFVAKFQPDGTPLWSKRFGGLYDDTARAVAVDSSGNIYVVGSFKGTVNFGGGSLSSAYMGFGPQMRDAFMLKLSAAGAHVWSKRLGGEDDDNAYGVAVDVGGNVVVTGYFRGPVDFGNSTTLQSDGMLSDIFLAKYTSAGSLVWAKGFGDTSNDNGNGVAVDGSGNVFLTGSFTGTVDFGGGAKTSIDNTSDIFLAKFTSQGAHVWSKQFGDSGLDVGTGVAADVAGNVALTGYFQASVDLGGGEETGFGVLDAFVAKYSPTGTYVWGHVLGGAEVDEGFGIATDSGGNVFIVGTMQATADFGTGPMESAGSYDVAVAKFAPGGTPLWTQRFGGAGDDFGYAVATDGNGNAVLTGVIQGVVDFGAGPVPAIGVTDLFLLSLSP